jgi:UDP-glucose-4-epimerase GalE
MTVLVTGGAGYIGSHTVRALREADRDVVVLDSLELGRAEAVLDAELVVGTIQDAELVTRLCADRGVTAIVHFAAYKSVGESMQSPGKYWHNNVGGTATLVEAGLRAGVRDVVFSSSCSVYGMPAHVPVVETAAIAPESVYAETKATVERMLRWYGVIDGLRSASLRYFNAAGASSDIAIGEDWDFSINLVPLVMKAVLGVGPPVKVFGTDYETPDGTCIRDYIHVEDLADAHVRALDALERAGERPYLGGAQPRTSKTSSGRPIGGTRSRRDDRSHGGPIET